MYYLTKNDYQKNKYNPNNNEHGDCGNAFHYLPPATKFVRLFSHERSSIHTQLPTYQGWHRIFPAAPRLKVPTTTFA